MLHRAWASVRRSGFSSTSIETKNSIKRFEKNWINNVERIAAKLRANTFEFEGERGIAPSKGKGKQGRRPIVLAPIENRVVRRAILEVLQGYGCHDGGARNKWQGVAAIKQVMEMPTSVGGIPHRGVPHGLALIDEAVRIGHCWFVRSDIKDFFTRISITDVISFISHAVPDRQFIALFEKALTTNLINRDELEERRLFKLFPDGELGVAQGSALSALAGNIVLRGFDCAMNGRGIVCVRYIDDFILLGKSERSVRTCYASAQTMLRQMGMQAYDLNDEQAARSGKVDAGNIYSGTDVLGYRISGTSRQPCAAACRALLAKLDQVVTDAKKEMKIAAAGVPSPGGRRYHRASVLMHDIVWGWSQAFRHATAGHAFEKLRS